MYLVTYMFQLKKKVLQMVKLLKPVAISNPCKTEIPNHNAITFRPLYYISVSSLISSSVTKTDIFMKNTHHLFLRSLCISSSIPQTSSLLRKSKVIKKAFGNKLKMPVDKL